MKTKNKCRLFEENSQYAILSDIFAKAASLNPEKLGIGDCNTKNCFYVYLKETPYTTMMVHLADAMTDLGYKIVEVNEGKKYK